MKKFYTFKLLLAAMLVALAGTAAAQSVVTFDFTASGAGYGGTSAGEAVTEFSEGDVSVTVGKDPNVSEEQKPQQSKMFTNQFRFYKYGMLTLDAGTKKITSVKFVASSNYKASDITQNGTALDASGVWSGNASQVTFGNVGQVRLDKIIVALDGATIADDPVAETPEYTLPYTNSMLKDNKDFTIDNKSMPSDLTFVWTFNAQQGAKASAYKNAAYATESWLLSPIFDLTAETGATLSFEHATNKFESVQGAKDAVSLLVREDGSEAWTKLDITEWSENKDWTYVANTVDLSAYAGKKIQLAFKYTSTTQNCGTWEIINFSLIAAGYVLPPAFDPEPGTYLGSVNVTLEAGDGCSIYYGLGSNAAPTLPYLGPITLTAGDTIRAIAENEEGDQSELVEGVYTIIQLQEGDVTRFDFAANEWNLPTSSSATGQIAVGNITAPITNADGAVITFTAGEEDSNKPRMWQGTTYIDARMFTGQTIALAAPKGKQIAQICFYTSAKDKVALTAEDGRTVSGFKVTDAEAAKATLEASKFMGVYTPEAAVSSATFTANATNYFTEIALILVDGGNSPYDLNNDGSVDVSDVTLLVSVVLESGNDPKYDLNNDGSVDVSDVTLLVSVVLTQE
ncbi:MAG: choice-of-anchor J domain-containing protein [Alloprevotella sp.]|nr:choice-of-anchor J domain-containing protein [Alloprevotella sp.]